MNKNLKTVRRVLVSLVIITAVIIGVLQFKDYSANLVKKRIANNIEKIDSGKPVVVNLDTHLGQQVVDKAKEQPTIVIAGSDTFAVWNTSKATNQAIININKK